MVESGEERSERNLVTIEAVFAAGLAHLPDFLSKTAFGALSRLVTGLVDIPVIALSGYKERLEDKNRESRSLRRSLSDAAIAKIINDEAMVQRTIDRLMNEQIAKQQNREAVATETLRFLENRGTLTSEESIDEEWLDSFSEKASKAYSPDARTMWSRVLAGELAIPGSYSRRSLAVLESLDQNEAETFSRIVKLSFGNVIPAASIGTSGTNFSEARLLEDLGLLSGVSSKFRKPLMHTPRSNIGGLSGRKSYLQVYSSASPMIEVVFLTTVGGQLAHLVDDTNGELERNVARLIGLSLKGKVDAAVLIQQDDKKVLFNPEPLFGPVRCFTVDGKVYTRLEKQSPSS